MSGREEGGSGDDGGKVVQLRPAVVSEADKAPGPEQVVPFYPPKLKSYYLDVLAKYKEQQSTARGKVVGWLTIRDEIMASEDAKLSEKMRREGLEVEVDRPRSAALTLDDIKGWYKAGRSHLPSDGKFRYIDRFVRGLRLQGGIDVIERGFAESRREYLRDALASFYRPDVHLANVKTDMWLDALDGVSHLLHKASFAGFVKNRVNSGGRGQFLLLVLCGTFRRSIVPVDVMFWFVPNEKLEMLDQDGVQKEELAAVLGSLRPDEGVALHIYSGFVIPQDGAAANGDIAFELVRAKISLVLNGWAGGKEIGVDLSRYNRYYDPVVMLSWGVAGAIDWDSRGLDALNELGLRHSKSGMANLFKMQEMECFDFFRGKFGIGYRAC